VSCSGLIECLELAEVGPVVAGDLGDLERENGVEALGGLPVRAVQLSAELLKRSLRRGVEAQTGADLRPRRCPRGSLEQLRPRVGEPARAGDEHVAVAAVARQLARAQEASRHGPQPETVRCPITAQRLARPPDLRLP